MAALPLYRTDFDHKPKYGPVKRDMRWQQVAVSICTVFVVVQLVYAMMLTDSSTKQAKLSHPSVKDAPMGPTVTDAGWSCYFP